MCATASPSMFSNRAFRMSYRQQARGNPTSFSRCIKSQVQLQKSAVEGMNSETISWALNLQFTLSRNYPRQLLSSILLRWSAFHKNFGGVGLWCGFRLSKYSISKAAAVTVSASSIGQAGKRFLSQPREAQLVQYGSVWVGR